MKSKTSFFNKAIFKKNITLYWPIWVCYLLYGIVKLSGGVWSGLHQMTKVTDERKYIVMAQSLSLTVDLWVIAAVAVITGMALFSYLFSAKSANMIHALPVNRTELFFTNVISGLCMMWVPQAATFLLSVVVCLANGIALVQYLGIWLLTVMGISFFLFSVVVFSAMFTGQLFAMPFCFFGLNYLALGILVGVRCVVSALGYGLSYGTVPDVPLFRVLSPLNYLQSHVRFATNGYYNQVGDNVITGVSYHGGYVVACYAVVAIGVYLLAFYGYKKRELECAGDLLVFRWLRPVFRWGVGGCAAYAGAILLAGFFDSVLIWISVPVLFVMVLVFGVIAFLLADMLVQKTFRVVKKKRIRECGMFLILAAISFGGFYAVASGLQNKIPDQEDISYAYLDMNYPVEFTGDDVQKVISMQQDILDHATEFQKDLGDQAYMYVVTYALKNGKRLSRSYRIPASAEGGREVMELQYSYETEPENFLRYVFGYDYDEITDFQSSSFEYYEDNNYMNKVVDKDTAYKLYQAIVADAKDGVIQKYNTVDFANAEEDPEYETASLNLSYMHNSSNWEDIYQRESGSKRSEENYADADSLRAGYIYIAFGRDCKHIINTLVEAGLMESADDPVFYTNGQG